jgi:L-alanine-DL-glutamate epimerase-like enolase superfamily enzyme
MMRLRLYAELLDLRLHALFQVADYRTESFETVVTALLDEETGAVGVGEAPVNAVHTAPAAAVAKELEEAAAEPWLAGARPDPDRPGRLSRPYPPGLSAPARCGIESAALDLAGKLLGRPVWALWSGTETQCPVTSITVSGRGRQQLAAELARLGPLEPAAVKVKLAPFTDHADVRQRLCLVRAEFPGVPLRVDMNASWALAEFRDAIGYLSDLSVTHVEEPLVPSEPLSTYRMLRERVPFELVADERTLIHRPRELAGAFDLVNLKQSYLGGPLGVLADVRNAREHGLGVMLGCNGESSIGISTMIQLAPHANALDLDSALLAADDPFAGPPWRGGRPLLQGAPGCGHRLVHPDRVSERLARLVNGRV